MVTSKLTVNISIGKHIIRVAFKIVVEIRFSLELILFFDTTNAK